MANKLGSAFSTMPFDKKDSVYATVLQDDFITAVAVADADPDVALLSELNWTIDLVAGDSVPHVDVVAGAANHPGIISLETGATTPADGDAVSLTLGNGVAAPVTFKLDSNGIYIATILRIPDVDAQKVSFGLHTAGALPNASAVDFVGLVFDPEDAANVGDKMWFLQVNAANVDTEVVFDTALYDENEWVLLELYASSTRAVARVSVDSGAAVAGVTSQATTQIKEIVTTMPTVGFGVGYQLETLGAAEEVLEIDKFTLRYLRKTEESVLG